MPAARPQGLVEILPLAAAGLCAVAIGAQIVVLAHHRPDAAVEVPPVAVPAAPALTPALAGLFGSRVQVAHDSAEPVTSLVLTGVIATTDPARGWAIVGPSATTTAMYGVGSSLKDGQKLVGVYADHVVLEDPTGTRRTLSLPHTFNDGAIPGVYKRIVNNRAIVMGPELPPAASNREAVSPAITKLRFPRSEVFWAAWTGKGYRLSSGTNPDRYAALHLLPSDTVIAVDDKPLGPDGASDKMLTRLITDTSSSVKLTIERNGVQQQIIVTPAAVSPGQ